MLLITSGLSPKELVKFKIFVHVSNPHLQITGFNILLPNLINIFKVRTSFYVLNSTFQMILKLLNTEMFLYCSKKVSFLCHFLMITIILQLAMGMFDIYRFFSYNLYDIYNSSYCLFQLQQLLSYLDICQFSQPAAYNV